MRQNGNVKQTSTGSLTSGGGIQYVVQHQNVNDAVDPATFTYSRLAGDWVAFIFDAGQFSEQAQLAQQQTINQAALAGQNANSDAQIGASLALAGMRYFQQADQQADFIGSLQYAYVLRNRVGSGLVTSKSTVQAAATQEIPFIPDRANVDFKNGVTVAFDLGGTATTFAALLVPDTNKLIGINASAVENAVLEETFSTQGVSTTRRLEQARNQSIPVYVITTVAGLSQLDQNPSDPNRIPSSRSLIPKAIRLS